MVIGAHAIGAFGLPGWLQPFAFIIDGDLGVRIFFCISGFLITHLLLHERKRTGSIDLKAFYVRRALRIIPVAYAFIAVLLILTALGQLHLPACNFVTALTFTKNYACAALPDGHLWSLAVEEQFYLLWPFVVAYCTPSRSLLIAAMLCAIAPISRAAEYLAGDSLFTWLPSNADGLMIGAVLAYMAILRRDTLTKVLPARPWQKVLCVFFIVLPIYIGRHLILGPFTVMLGPTMQAIAITCLMASFTFGKERGYGFNALNSAPVIYVGLISYSLYIWQELFFIPSAPPWALCGLLVLAIVSYQFWEQPIRGFYRKRNKFLPASAA